MNTKIRMADPFFSPEDRARFHREADSILSGLLSMGPHVASFEKEFAAVVGVRHAVAMNSCTAALESALIALGIQPGDEVIVPAETFIATGMAVMVCGAKPVFAEISPQTFCLDLADMKKRVTPRTKGIILVEFAGLIPEEIVPCRQFCDERGLFLIEDAAHATGAELKGRKAGSFGHAACFSFYPTKVLTAGEGGMLVTNDDQIAEVAQSLQNRGRDMASSTERYIRPGRNLRLPELSALLGRIQLSHLEEYLTARRRIVATYRESLAGERRLGWILPSQEKASTYWKIPLLLPESIDRQKIAETMKGEGIEVDFTYDPPLHLQPVFQNLLGTKAGSLPVTEKLLSRHLCLPCHPGISNDEAQRVARTLAKSLQN